MRVAALALSLLLILVMGEPRAHAQLVAPGANGVAMGHIHIVGRDLDAHRKFWVLLGGVPTKNGTLEMVQFPGAFVNLRQGEPTSGSVGTVVNHIGFNVKNMSEWVPKWQAAGLTIEQPRPTQVYVMGPDGVRVEFLEDATIATPVKFHHIHYMVPDVAAAQAWYAKTYGAVPGKRGPFDAADLPGVNLTFSKADGAVVKTQGSVIDHIGFEINGLEAYLNNLKTSGVKLDREYGKSAAAPTLSISYTTDPWGTYIEMTEGLTPR